MSEDAEPGSSRHGSHPQSVSAARVAGVAVGGVLLWILIVLALAPAASAVPAFPTRFPLDQPNGAHFSAHKWGDEWNHGYENARGYAIAQDSAGVWRYAVRTHAGRLKPGTRKAQLTPPQGLSRHLRPAPRALEANPNSQAAIASEPKRMPHMPASQPTLVILVQTTTRSSITPPSEWANRYFGPSKSVADYYSTASLGQTTFAPAQESYGTANDGVVGWVTINNPMANTIDQTDAWTMDTVRLGVAAADPYVNFASYDTNHDGFIEYSELHVTFVIAGYEASYGNATPSIWAHEWDVDTNPPNVDGVKVAATGYGGYTMFGELERATNASSDQHSGTIGTITHELGHDQGLPDLYDIDSNVSWGLGWWSLMAGGASGKGPGDQWYGQTPTLPDAWSRYALGWVTPMRANGLVTLRNAENYPDVLELRDNTNGMDWNFGSPHATGEYFLVENRQQTGYDVDLPGCGLIIYHVDESQDGGNLTKNNRQVDVEEANGTPQNLDGPQSVVNSGDAGDPFPGSTNNRTFNDSTNPNAHLYSGAASGVSVSQVGGDTGNCATPSTSMTLVAHDPDVLAPNDAFASAIQLTGTPVTRTGDASDNATKEAGEPNHAGNAGGASVWYRWTAPETGTFSIDTAGSAFDTLLGVYTGGAVNTLSEVASNDDNGASPTSKVTFDATQGTEYRIAVDGKNTGAGAAFGVLALHIVGPQDQVITFPAITDHAYGDADFGVSATASSALPVSFTASGQCSVAGSSVHVTAAGSCTITAHQAGNGSWHAAPDVARTFQIAKAAQTIAFSPLGDKTFGDPDVGVSATAASGLPVTWSVTGQCTNTGSIVHLTGAGACAVKASQAGDANWNAAPDVTRTFQIAKGPQTITFAPLPDKTYGDADFLVSASASSGLNVTFNGTGQCTVTGRAVHLLGAGSCTVTAQQSGNANWLAAPDVARTFTINKHAQTISFASLPDHTYGDSDFGVSATSSAGLPVSFIGSGQCDVTGTSVHLTAPGSCTVTAQQGGNANYAAAPDVPRTFQIQTPSKLDQTITFAQPPNHTFGDADFTVTATSSSGLDVSLAAQDQCSLSGSSSGSFVHLLGAGSCTITASQAGDASYNVAPDVVRSFTIAKAPTSTSLVLSPPSVVHNTKVTFTATVTTPGGGTPLGKVVFFSNGVKLGGANLVNGIASKKLLVAGAAHQKVNLVAKYKPGAVGANYLASKSPTLKVTLT